MGPKFPSSIICWQHSLLLAMNNAHWMWGSCLLFECWLCTTWYEFLLLWHTRHHSFSVRWIVSGKNLEKWHCVSEWTGTGETNSMRQQVEWIQGFSCWSELDILIPTFNTSNPFKSRSRLPFTDCLIGSYVGFSIHGTQTCQSLAHQPSKITSQAK